MLIKNANIITGLIILAIGLITFVYGVIEIRQSATTESWPTVEGEVISSHSNIMQSSKNQYRASVRYKYSVNDKQYSSGGIWYGDRFFRHFFSGHKATRYPIGKKIVVSYNSEIPEMAILYPGINYLLVFYLLAGTVCILWSLVFLIPVMSRKNRS